MLPRSGGRNARAGIRKSPAPLERHHVDRLSGVGRDRVDPLLGRERRNEQDDHERCHARDPGGLERLHATRFGPPAALAMPVSHDGVDDRGQDQNGYRRPDDHVQGEEALELLAAALDGWEHPRRRGHRRSRDAVIAPAARATAPAPAIAARRLASASWKLRRRASSKRPWVPWSPGTGANRLPSRPSPISSSVSWEP